MASINKYPPTHPLASADDEFLALLDLVDPNATDDHGFAELIEAAPNQRVRDWLAGMMDHWRAAEIVAGR